MVHARELIHLTDYDEHREDDYHRAIYDYFRELERPDIVLQLERLFIFNYLVLNMDFHDENFGILYDNNLRFISSSPGYDYNSAFGEYEDTKFYYKWIFNNLQRFIKDHEDVKNRLQSKEFHKVLNSIKELNDNQKKIIKERAEYLISIYNK